MVSIYVYRCMYMYIYMYVYRYMYIYMYVYVYDVINNILEKASDRILSIVIDRDGLLLRQLAEISCGVLYMPWDFRTTKQFVRTFYGL